MPFKNFFKKRNSSPEMETKTADKHLLTLKCMQSQQTTEPVYDLSGCNTSYVPDQTFTYCKLLSKTSLILHSNSLTSLENGGSISDLVTIEVLDIHANNFSELPSEICYLQRLIRIDASNNCLKSLPSSFSKLKSLQDLNLNNNHFSKVPLALCALPALHKLSLDGNKIKRIPNDFHSLQSSLGSFSVECESLEDPFRNLLRDGNLEDLMKRLCFDAGVEYTGIQEKSNKEDTATKPKPRVPQTEDVTPVMANYLLKKRQEMLDQLLRDKELEESNEGELHALLQKQVNEKKKLLEIVSSATDAAAELDPSKLKDQQWKVQLEKEMKEKQDEEIGAYLANTSSKNDKIESLAAHEEQLNRDLQGIVGDRSADHKRLLDDLNSSEQRIAAITEEIISGAAGRNAAFVKSLQEQEGQLQELLIAASGAQSEIRENEVLRAMQQMLSETVMLESKLHQGDMKEGWIGALVEASNHTELELNDIMAARQSDVKNWNELLLHDQACQAAAFKLLLLNNDIKRSNIVQQVSDVFRSCKSINFFLLLDMIETRASLQYFNNTSIHNEFRSITY